MKIQEQTMLAFPLKGSGKSSLRIYIVMLLLVAFLESCHAYGPNTTFIYEVKDYPAYHLIWSPTGRYLAFTSRSGSLNMSSIYVLDLETKEAQVLVTTEYGYLEALGWTSDESELVFIANSSRDLQNGIWMIQINNPAVFRFYSEEENALGWSSADKIVIGRLDQANVLSISVLDSQTQEESSILSQPGLSVGPVSWSAKAEKLAFALDVGQVRRRDIYVANLETEETLQITTQGTNDSPSLSPSGNLVVYVNGDFSGTSPAYSLHIMNSDGSCDTPVPSLEHALSPAWSPDGKWIAFIGRGNRVYLLNPSSVFGTELLTQGLFCK